jgi:hypothetical protein
MRADVRFGSLANMATSPRHLRFVPDADITRAALLKRATKS